MLLYTKLVLSLLQLISFFGYKIPRLFSFYYNDVQEFLTEFKTLIYIKNYRESTSFGQMFTNALLISLSFCVVKISCYQKSVCS